LKDSTEKAYLNRQDATIAKETKEVTIQVGRTTFASAMTVGSARITVFDLYKCVPPLG
jgi:hypothetical protein